ncbi:MAG: hypothetical protein E7645_06390 [Ruminococcaceae bacterium]|nr:hypothetical protein [Oscillospiraceae bacterium]
MASFEGFCIGIDGGGTKTEGILTDISGRVLSAQTYGSSNPNDVGEAEAMELLSLLTRDLMISAGVTFASPVCIFAGVSGAWSKRDVMTQALSERFGGAVHVEVHSDVINLLSTMSPTGEGACLISGTGSVCFLRRGNELDRVGGWGYLLDSAGSGYDVGRMALEAVLKAHDGRADAEIHTPLSQAVTAHLGGSPWDILPAIYEKGKAYIASCAPVVFRLAEKGDKIANKILNENAAALAACLTAAVEKLPECDALPVILGGSLCTKEPTWMTRIQGFLKADISPRITMMITDVPPVFGALAEALGGFKTIDRPTAFDGFKSAFLQTYHS